MKKSNLMLHCGARAIGREELDKIPAPAATVSWHPVRYSKLVGEVERSLKAGGMRIVQEQYGVTPENKKMFGLLQIGRGNLEPRDYGFVIGIRGSIDKTMAEGIAVGASVFVCDNMSFNSEIVMNRKNTRNIMDDLPLMVDSSIAQLGKRWSNQTKQFGAYKETEMTKDDAYALIVKAAESEVFPWVKVKSIVEEFNNPRHAEFKGGTVWTLFNSVTEYMKPREDSMNVGLWSLPARTARLHALCDTYAGLSLNDPAQVEVATLENN